MILKLILSDIKTNFFKIFITIFTIFIIVFLWLFLFIINKNIENFVFNFTWLYDRLENPNILEVSLWWFWNQLVSWYNPELLLNIDWNELIDEIYYFYSISAPNSLSLNLFWTLVETDFLLYAWSDELFINSTSDNIPLWISQRVLDIYNLELSNLSIFPRLSNRELQLLTFEIKFNNSNIFWISNSDIVKNWKITTVNSLFPMLWISIPYSVAIDVFDKDDLRINKAIVLINDIQNIDKFKELNSNLHIKSAFSQYEWINNKLSLIRFFFMIIYTFVFIIWIVFFFFLIHSMIYDNNRLFFILRSNWANWFVIFKIILWKILFSLFISYFLLFIFINIFNFLLLNNINDIIKNEFFFEFDLIWFTLINYFYSLFFWFIFSILLVFLISKKQINKLYIN